MYKVRKAAKIRNQYNEVSHLTQDTTLVSDKNTIKHHKHEPRGQPFNFPAGDHKAAMNKPRNHFIVVRFYIMLYLMFTLDCTLAYMCTHVCFYKPAYLYMCMYASIGLSIRLCVYMFLCMFLLVCLSVSAHICFY